MRAVVTLKAGGDPCGPGMVHWARPVAPAQSSESAMTVAETWHTFMLRKTLLTHWSVCFDFFGASLRDPIVRNTAASLLYIDLLSLLDEALQARMPPKEYERGQVTKNRLEMLARKGDLLKEKALQAIRERRNEIGHEFETGATVEELDAALSTVKEQLLSWGMIREIGDYELVFKSSRRDSEDEKTAFELDMIIRVKAGGEVWLEMKQTEKIGKIGS